MLIVTLYLYGKVIIITLQEVAKWVNVNIATIYFRFLDPATQKAHNESLWDGIPFIKKATENASEHELARDATLIWKKKVSATRRRKKYNQIGKVAFPVVLTIGTVLYFLLSYMYKLYA